MRGHACRDVRYGSGARLGRNPSDYVGIVPKDAPSPRLTLVIAIDDAGNERMDTFSDEVSLGSIIHRGGETYIVQKSGTGWVVMRQADLITARRERYASSPGAKMSPDNKYAVRYEVVDLGPTAIAGRTGERYGVREHGMAAKPELFRQYVISADPALAPLGRAVAREMMESLWNIPGSSNSDLEEKIVEVLSKGTPLEVDKIASLDAVEAANIPAATFDLPGPVLSLDQVRARMARPLVTFKPPPPPPMQLPKR